MVKSPGIVKRGWGGVQLNVFILSSDQTGAIVEKGFVRRKLHEKKKMYFFMFKINKKKLFYFNRVLVTS